MPNAQMPSEQEYAMALVGQLLANLNSDPHRESFLEPMDVFTADVEFAVDRFRIQYLFFRNHGERFPCLALEGRKSNPIPIDLGFAMGWPWDRPWPIPPRPWVQDQYKQVGLRIEEHSPEGAAEFLKSALTSFLTTRLKARQSDISRNRGLQFTVKTKKRGLRVHYSPAYFFTPHNVFGSPTTPVVSWIQPGRYLFGVQGPQDSEPRFDNGEYDIPPQTTATLTIA